MKTLWILLIITGITLVRSNEMHGQLTSAPNSSTDSSYYKMKLNHDDQKRLYSLISELALDGALLCYSDPELINKIKPYASDIFLESQDSITLVNPDTYLKTKISNSNKSYEFNYFLCYSKRNDTNSGTTSLSICPMIKVGSELQQLFWVSNKAVSIALKRKGLKINLE